MKKCWLQAFISISVLHITWVLFGINMLSTCTKPLLMPLLALWFVSNTSGLRLSLRSGWLIGLCFSTLGDILLLFNGGLFFLLGLSAFLLAHISYIGSIVVGLRERRGFLLRNPGWILPFLLYPIFMLYILWSGIPESMRIPVALYALVISSMAQAVANLRGSVADTTFRTMMAGALLFVLSDSLLAIDKFGQPFAGAHVAIMTTYILGQYLLVKGVLAIIKDATE